MPTSQSHSHSSKSKQHGITRLAVEGFKSISRRTEFAVRPLTIIAGANSAGKSSLIQPLLLLKQTIEAPYDPGALLLDGPNVRFTAATQLLSRLSRSPRFSIAFDLCGSPDLELTFKHGGQGGFEIESMIAHDHDGIKTLAPQMDCASIKRLLGPDLWKQHGEKCTVHVRRDRCFLNFEVTIQESPRRYNRSMITRSHQIERSLRDIIHLPGLRGNPERTYNTTAIDSYYPGTFERYVASIISHWEETGDREQIRLLERRLHALALTSSIHTRHIEDTRVEVRVGRVLQTKRTSVRDLVSIADVGIGVSQVLPVLVALQVAPPSQLVCLEQPELHLHPRAQLALGEVLAEAATGGCTLVVETHSSLLLRGVQTAVAGGKISPDVVNLIWAKRDRTGATRIEPGTLDESGAFGNWPQDFDDVSMGADRSYLNLVAARRRK